MSDALPEVACLNVIIAFRKGLAYGAAIIR